MPNPGRCDAEVDEFEEVWTDAETAQPPMKPQTPPSTLLPSPHNPTTTTTTTTSSSSSSSTTTTTSLQSSSALPCAPPPPVLGVEVDEWSAVNFAHDVAAAGVGTSTSTLPSTTTSVQPAPPAASRFTPITYREAQRSQPPLHHTHTALPIHSPVLSHLHVLIHCGGDTGSCCVKLREVSMAVSPVKAVVVVATVAVLAWTCRRIPICPLSGGGDCECWGLPHSVPLCCEHRLGVTCSHTLRCRDCSEGMEGREGSQRLHFSF